MLDEKKIQAIDNEDLNAISVPMETVEVIVSSKELMSDYAKAFVREAKRVNPQRWEQVQLTEEEMVAYSKFLLVQRIKSVNDECTDWRKLKRLYIPVFLQYTLRMIGIVTMRDIGLRMVPVLSEDDVDTITVEEALAISEKISYWDTVSDGLSLVVDAMPRSREGDESVMSTAMIAGYARSIKKVKHVVDTYVTKFLNMKLKEELAFKVLYRVQYDDADYIATALTGSWRRFM